MRSPTVRDLARAHMRECLMHAWADLASNNATRRALGRECFKSLGLDPGSMTNPAQLTNQQCLALVDAAARACNAL